MKIEDVNTKNKERQTMKRCLFCNSRIREKDPICFSEKKLRFYCIKCAPNDGKEKIGMYYDTHVMRNGNLKIKLLFIFITLFVVPPVSILAVSFSTSVVSAAVIMLPFLFFQCYMWKKILD